MEFEARFYFEEFNREERVRARMEAEKNLEQMNKLFLEMSGYYRQIGYNPPEKVKIKVQEQVETSGLQFNGTAGGLFCGREEGDTRIKLPWDTDLDSGVHEFAHDVAENMLDFKEDDSLQEHTFKEAFCDLNSLFFTGNEDEYLSGIKAAATPYRSSFERTFEGLWKALNPEFVEKRKTSVQNMLGSLEAIEETEDEELNRKLEQQFLEHLEEFRDTPPKKARMSYFSGLVPFFVTMIDENYRMPVNEEWHDGVVESRKQKNRHLSEFPNEPISDRATANKARVGNARAAAERLGDVEEVEEFGEFVYEFIKSDPGYSQGMEEDLDLAHTVGARITVQDYERGKNPREMIGQKEEYMDRIKSDICDVIDTWLAYTNVQKTLHGLNYRSEERERAVESIKSGLPDEYSGLADRLYSRDPADLEPEERRRLRNGIEAAESENWFVKAYGEPDF